MLSAGVVFGQQSWLVSMPVGASFGFHCWNNPLGGLIDGPAESTAFVRSRKFRPRHSDILSAKKAAATSAAA
jgi:hypothetical protein